MSRLKAVVLNSIVIIAWNRNLAFFTTSYNYAALVLPIAVVAPMFMRGEVEFGVVTQAAGAFAQVLAAVSLIITKFDGLSTYLAGVQRLGTLWDNLDDFDADEERVAREATQQLDEDSRIVKLDKLTVRTPSPSKTLVQDLSFELKRKQSLLIMGASGTGKSSVLRTIAGLWPSGSGALERPPLVELMFLPQRPYMIQGNLRDQLLYPYPERKVDDDNDPRSRRRGESLRRVRSRGRRSRSRGGLDQRAVRRRATAGGLCAPVPAQAALRVPRRSHQRPR